MRKRLLVALLVVLSGYTLVQPVTEGDNRPLSEVFDARRCETGAVPGGGFEDIEGEYPLELTNDSSKGIEQFVRSFERAYAYNEFDGRIYDNFSVSFSGTVVDTDEQTATVRVDRVSVVGRRDGTIAEFPHSVTYRLTTMGMTRNESRPRNPPPASTHNYVVECE